MFPKVIVAMQFPDAVRATGVQTVSEKGLIYKSIDSNLNKGQLTDYKTKVITSL
jgi:hypothetical protein